MGLTLILAVIRLELITATLTTVISVACTLPVDALKDVSGGEITTMAPGLKFEPTKVIRSWLTPCTGNSGEALVSTGSATATATVSVTAFEVPFPPVAKKLMTVTGSNAGNHRRLGRSVKADSDQDCQTCEDHERAQVQVHYVVCPNR